MVSADFGGNVAIWQIENGQFQLKNTLNLGRLRALAIDDDRRFAGASVDGRIFVTQPQSDDYSDLLPHQFLPTTPTIGLAWDEGRLLILSVDCEVRRVGFEPNPHVVFEHPILPLGQPPSFAVVTTQHGNDIAFARGASNLEVGDNWLAFYAHRSEIRNLAAAGASLFATAEALYWFDLSPATPVIHRIVVTDQVIVEARLAWFGGVRSASIRRRDGAPWIATTLGGRAVPNDPLLHMHLAVIESSGQLGEVFSSTNFFFSPDLRELRIEDPTIPPE